MQSVGIKSTVEGKLGARQWLFGIGMDLWVTPTQPAIHLRFCLMGSMMQCLLAHIQLKNQNPADFSYF